jgi:hypothetical protein
LRGRPTRFPWCNPNRWGWSPSSDLSESGDTIRYDKFGSDWGRVLEWWMTAWRQVRGRIPGQKHPGDPVAEVSHPVRPVTRDDPHRTDCLSPLTHGRLLFRSVPFVRSFVLSPSSFLFPLEINFSRYSEKPNASTSARTPCVVSFSVVCCHCVCLCCFCRRRFVFLCIVDFLLLSFILYPFPRAGTLFPIFRACPWSVSDVGHRPQVPYTAFPFPHMEAVD